MMALYQTVTGPLEYKHDDGTISLVQVELAGMGLKKSEGSKFTPGNAKWGVTRSAEYIR
jgi:hypothetical protein